MTAEKLWEPVSKDENSETCTPDSLSETELEATDWNADDDSCWNATAASCWNATAASCWNAT